ncbi:phage polarity suppression protein [Salmonella enterica]|uniref:Phage polarity suppression protein n=1 Tax=Salmonella enterica TaxID=28901 RepID=A0A5U0R7X7_SALER|nr:phage polarity suppression protein [Salmonella enterica]EBQ6228330.1 phage polarity suppression protein [Salmonella enterica subsp. enterica serovar Newport]EBO5051283.1 phage polarity suppression protein [Salmonella enterica]ECK4066876.1 phage polarity suppression protein [Salmonella enterica]ECN1058386.1 phage polarity suppression protein [Salmonella enterica subsp. enterica serovar Newport]EJE0919859.1 phage polarity suppression protein [Salmonella enterica]
MTGPTLQNAFEACQTNKATWMNLKAELAATELEYRDLLLDDATGSRRLQTLRELIDIKKWEINQAAGRYIRSHEEVQCISIRNRLHDFMQQNGAELAAALAPELMEVKNQPAMIKNRALDRSMTYLREALSIWLAAGNDINYSAQDNDILTAIGYRPDVPSRDDNRETFTPAQSMIYTRRRAELAAQ